MTRVADLSKPVQNGDSAEKGLLQHVELEVDAHLAIQCSSISLSSRISAFAYHPIDQDSSHLGQNLLAFKYETHLYEPVFSIPSALPGSLPSHPGSSPLCGGSCRSHSRNQSPKSSAMFNLFSASGDANC